MNNQLWSYILTFVGVIGFILAGRKVWWCWYINIGCQALWVSYALITKQYGFIIGAVVYTFVFTQNAIKWTKERHRISSLIKDPIGIITNMNKDFNGLSIDFTIDHDVESSIKDGVIENRIMGSHRKRKE